MPVLSAAKLAKKKSQNEFVGIIAAILARGEPTPFRFEASVRTWLRSSWCLQGSRWDVADAYATLVIELALHKLHVVRPTWLEGQYDFAQQSGVRKSERWFCHCGNLLPEGQSKHCSARCRLTYAHLRWARQNQHKVHAANAAFMAAWRERQPAKVCVHCGVEFKPKHRPKAGPQVYCSQQCYWKAIRGKPKGNGHAKANAMNGNGHANENGKANGHSAPKSQRSAIRSGGTSFGSEGALCRLHLQLRDQ